jgi:hypothetical protein
MGTTLPFSLEPSRNVVKYSGVNVFGIRREKLDRHDALFVRGSRFPD